MSLQITFVNNIGYCSCAEASRYLELSRARISQLVNSGTFDSIVIGSSVLVPALQVEAYKNANIKRGPKPKN